MPKSGIAESYGSSMYRFLRDLQTVLHSGCTSLHSHVSYKWSHPPRGTWVLSLPCDIDLSWKNPPSMGMHLLQGSGGRPDLPEVPPGTLPAL